jgi:hypothetical protein
MEYCLLGAKEFLVIQEWRAIGGLAGCPQRKSDDQANTVVRSWRATPYAAATTTSNN